MSRALKQLVAATARTTSGWTMLWSLLVVFATMPLVACSEQREDISRSEQYRSMVGAEFRVVEAVAAYGIYRYPQQDEVLYATIIPGVGIAGPEIAYKKDVPKGTVLSIQKVVKIGRLLGSRIDYIVVANNDSLPKDVEVHVEMRRGNEGNGLSLNSSIYVRIK